MFLDTLLLTVRRDAIKFAGNRNRKRRERETFFEKKVENLERRIDRDTSNTNIDNISELKNTKTELEEIRQEKVQGIIVRSRAYWHEYGEKCSKYFLNLENRNYLERKIQRLIKDDGEEINCEKEILKELSRYYSQLYEKKDQISNQSWQNQIKIEKIKENERKKLEGQITYEELTNAVKCMKNNKSPGSDGFPVEFFQFFVRKCKYSCMCQVLPSVSLGARVSECVYVCLCVCVCVCVCVCECVCV